jgi:hypothetical protein
MSRDKNGRQDTLSGHVKREKVALSADISFEEFVAGIAQVRPDVRVSGRSGQKRSSEPPKSRKRKKSKPK